MAPIPCPKNNQISSPICFPNLPCATSTACTKHSKTSTALHLGTTSWSNEDWEGLIYPQGGSAQDDLEHYARTFHAVEVDTT